MEEWVEVSESVAVLERRGPGTSIEPVRALTPDEILQIFAGWMRLDVADGNASRHTLRAYMADVRQHLEWLVGHGMSPASATEDVLKAYRAWLIEHGYAVSTAGRKLVGVRRFYEMAHAHGKISENPAARLKSPVDHTSSVERIKYFTFEAVRKVLAMPTQLNRDERAAKGLRDRAMLTLFAMHGLRTIEMHRLSLGDFDPDDEDWGSLRLFGKGNKFRTILLVEESRRILDAWLQARGELQTEDEALFVTLHWGLREGEEPFHRISTRSIRAMVDGYLEAAGVKKRGMSCHAFRHSCATLSLAMGASLKSIADMFGHASVTTTEVYAQILDRVKNNPAKLLGGLVDLQDAE